jgi:phosphomannomutase
VIAVHDYRSGGSTRPRWLPDAELVEFELEGGRVLVRPSGTEPKLKVYVDWRAEPRSRGSLSAEREALGGVADGVAAELFSKLGLVCEDARR